jgi:hypothetical protein
MDLVRNIISNLYIYKLEKNDPLNMNDFGLKILSNENNEIDKNENIINQNIETDANKINKNLVEYNKFINHNNKEDNINIKNNPFKKNNSFTKLKYSIKNIKSEKSDVNYILKNKELLKEQENQMKEIKQKKENEALSLLFSFKNKNTEGVRPRIFDYEIKQQKEKKNNKLNIRNLSSQKQMRAKNIINEKNNENLITMNQEEYKIKKSFTKSLKMPHIKSTPSGLDGIPLLHKDYGKMPEYLEKRKKELEEQKELKIKMEKEKKIPSGYKLLSEEERETRLNSLKDEKKKLEDELYKLPIARLSNQQLEYKKNIENSLSEIDEKMNKLIGYKEVII